VVLADDYYDSQGDDACNTHKEQARLTAAMTTNLLQIEEH
jgi:hypothetical protein